MNITHTCLVNYSPRGTSKKARESRRIRGNVKSARNDWIQRLVNHYRDHLTPLLDAESTLVPIPRSAPLKRDAPWPALTIAEALLSEGLAAGITPCLERHTAIRKSSTCRNARERPLIGEHMDSMRVRDGLLQIPAPKITLVDDFLTLGRTGIASALVLKEACPEANIRLFTLLRTRSIKGDIRHLIYPVTGKVSGTRKSGKATRKP